MTRLLALIQSMTRRLGSFFVRSLWERKSKTFAPNGLRWTLLGDVYYLDIRELVAHGLLHSGAMLNFNSCPSCQNPLDGHCMAQGLSIANFEHGEVFISGFLICPGGSSDQVSQRSPKPSAIKSWNGIELGSPGVICGIQNSDATH
jgi:hypothetical protein